MAIQRSCDRGVAVVGGTEELPDAVRAGLGKQPRTGCSDPTATTITAPRPVGSLGGAVDWCCGEPVPGPSRHGFADDPVSVITHLQRHHWRVPVQVDDCQLPDPPTSICACSGSYGRLVVSRSGRKIVVATQSRLGVSVGVLPHPRTSGRGRDRRAPGGPPHREAGAARSRCRVGPGSRAGVVVGDTPAGQPQCAVDCGSQHTLIPLSSHLTVYHDDTLY
jgi:hypothetical protein